MGSNTLERAWQTYRPTAQTLEEITEPEKNTEPEETIEQGKTPKPEETSEPEEIAILTLRALKDYTTIMHKDAIEKAWCAFADADTIEEGRRDFNAAMSEIAQAKEEPSTPREKAPNTREEATRVQNRQQQQLARKHHGPTEAHQEDKARARRGAAVTDRRRCGSNTLDDLPNPREEEAHRPSEDPTKPREKEPEPREEPPTPRERCGNNTLDDLPNPREEETHRPSEEPTKPREEKPEHREEPTTPREKQTGPGKEHPEEEVGEQRGNAETPAPMHISAELDTDADKTKEAWQTLKATRGARGDWLVTRLGAPDKTGWPTT